jgi:hypothetical protein
MTVRRLTIRGEMRDVTITRLRAERVLASASAGPCGVSPSALLCVRRLSDPRPRTLRLHAGAIRPPPEWERAVADALEDALRGAAKPALEAVPAAANAVVFADRAELLACLAADWLSGEISAHWWWVGLVGFDVQRAVVIERWAQEPHYVPAALELLARRGFATAFAGALTRDEAFSLASATATAFALPALHALADAFASRDTVLAAPPTVEPTTVTRPASEPSRVPPWRVMVPETRSGGLEPEQELLLGLALALQRTPATVRVPAFAEEVRAWTVSAPAPTHPVGHGPDEATRRPARENRRPRSLPRLERRVDAPKPPRTSGGDSVRDERRSVAAAAHPVPSSVPKAARSLEFGQIRAASRPAAARRDRTDVAHPPFIDLEPIESIESIETALGGLFFLVNLALYLGLIADFSAPEDLGVDLSPWDLVALLGRRLLDETSRDDPVWALLARLARGDREPPGRAFDPPDAWRVPTEWLAPWPGADDWTWSSARGRLRVRHPAGFLVLDVPYEAGARERELQPYAPLRPNLCRGPIPAAGARGGPAARWADRLAAYVGPRLVLALGLDDPAELPRVLLRRPARVHVSPAHVDVVLALAQHPLEIRLAGLDRDPGWIPAAGRFLAFHFE